MVTLLDLKNAFGEVNHKILKTVLKYHHIPDEVINIILSLYDEYGARVTTKSFTTKRIKIERGVLQGDSLSPLLFNLIVNILVKTVDDEKIRCMGYVFDTTFKPRSWFQFADDTCIVSAHEEDNQLLCNAFTKWTVWADLKIRVDKCHTIGMRKFGSIHKQYEPVINICHERIPPLKDGEEFIYLGKVYNYEMGTETEKDNLTTELKKYLEKIDLLPLHSKFKIEIVQSYVYSKFRWRFTIYPLTETWISNNIDNNINRYVRKWLQIPISGNITHLRLPKKKLGMNLRSAKDIYS